MERMKPSVAATRCQLLLLPSPHLIFISGAASTALGREQRNLTPAGPATSGAGAVQGRGSCGPEEEPRGPSPQAAQSSATRHGGCWRGLGGKEWRPRNSEGYSFLFSSAFAPSLHSLETEGEKNHACLLAPTFAPHPRPWGRPVCGQVHRGGRALALILFLMTCCVILGTLLALSGPQFHL